MPEPEPTVEKDLCEACGGTIECPYIIERFGPFVNKTRQLKCADCGFIEWWRTKVFVQKAPYRKPWDRPTPAPCPPARVVEQLKKTKEASRQIEEELR